MKSNGKKLIAVIGATGHQGGAVVRALLDRGTFKVRALSRNPNKHRGLAEETVEADLNRPETLTAAFEGAHGVFLVVWNGEYLPLVGDFVSFNEIVDTLNRQGHKFSFRQVPKEVFAALFPGGAKGGDEVADSFRYCQAYTYLGSESRDRIALANKIAGRQPSKFSTWARVNTPIKEAV